MGLWSQYRALLFKNWILWKRKVFGSLCEVLFPIGLIIVVGLIRATSLGTDYDKQDWATQVSKSYFISPDHLDYPTSDPNIFNVNPHSKFPFGSCANNVDGSIYSLSYSIITNDAEIKEDFIGYMVEKIRLLSGNLLTEHTEFDTISEFEDYVKSSDYEDNKKLCFGVYLNKLGSKKYDVSFRYNITENFPEPGRRLGDFQEIFMMDNLDYNELIVNPTDYLKNFYNYGFLTLNN
jgi:hypothetical protein